MKEEWESGTKCTYRGNGAVVVGWHPCHPLLVIDSNEFGLVGVSPDELEAENER